MTDVPSSRSRITVDDGTEILLDVAASPSAVYEMLADERRRRTLAVLAGASLPMDVRTLARRVAAEGDGRTAETTGEPVDRVHVSLYHVHLPKLADLGVVDYKTGGPVEAVAEDVEPFVP